VSGERDAGLAPPWGADSEYGRLRDVLLCRPEHYRWLPTSSISRATLASGAVFDADLAQRQHAEMMDAYVNAGVRVHYLEPDPHLPYQVFARDSSVMTPWGAIVTQMAQWWRRGEYAPVLRFYGGSEIRIFEMVTAGSLEGGDFHVIEPGCLLLGYSGERTQEQAARQVAAWLEAQGWEVRLEPIAEHYVHIDVLVSMLAPKLAAACVEAVSDELLAWLRAKGVEVLPVSYRDAMALGCNALALGDDRVLSTAQSADLNDRLRALGFTVYDPDLSMFTQGGGGVHCLCQALRRDPGG
jgi:N-dimethylarginine dimethylaminohydrolase